MSNLEILHQMIVDSCEQNLTPEQDSVVLLTSIAQSLAVIADRLTAEKGSVKNDESEE
jgi:hypothetical protein